MVSGLQNVLVALAQNARGRREIHVLQIEVHRHLAHVHIEGDFHAEALRDFLIGRLRLSAQLEGLRAGAMIELHRGHQHRLGNDLARAAGIQRFQFGEAFADRAVRRIQLHRIAQGMQRVRKMAGDCLAFGEVHFHLHDLALGDGLAHQVFAAAGVPIHGVGVGVVGRLPIAALLELQALLVGFLAFLYILFARRRGKLLFDSRSAYLAPRGFESVACRVGGGGIRAGLRNGVQGWYSQRQQERKKEGSRQHQG